MSKKRLLELFCGTKSVGNVFSNDGYEVISLDYNPKFEATHIEDFLTWDYKQYPNDYFDVVWASPDCSTWSLATGGKYRKKTHIYGLNNQYQEQATFANNMILRLIEILKYFKADYFIENPRGLLYHFPPLKDFVSENNVNNTLVYYSNYNDWGFHKPTHIWSNLPLWDKEVKPEMSVDKYYFHTRKCDGVVARMYYAYSNVKKRSETRSKIPPDLIKRLKDLIK